MAAAQQGQNRPAVTVLTSATADVGRAREALRRRRLLILAVVLGVPAAVLWRGIVTRSPIDVLAVPSIDPMTFLYVLFIVVLLGAAVIPMTIGMRSPHVLYRPEQLDVRLSDVVGIDVVRDEVIHSLNLFLSNRDLAENLGGRPRRGVLFEGGPGTGKTHTAKALAAEANVPFLFASGTSFHSSFQGATARKIRSYFRALRRVALKEGGAIGFIDEFDAIGMSRSGVTTRATGAAFAPLADAMRCGGLEGLPAMTMPATTMTSAALRSVGLPALTHPYGGGDLQMGVNELLVQMQSFDEPSGLRKLAGGLVARINLFLPLSRRLAAPRVPYANILLIASTNRAESLDPALMRPGRFDQRLTFELPTKRSRRELIDHFLAGKAHEGELDDPERRDALAAITQEYSPAMLERLLDDALIEALQDRRRAMRWSDVEEARLVMEVGLGQPVAYTDHEKQLIATHESGHATMAWLVAPQRRLEVLTIVKRRQALGLLAHGDRDDVFTRSRSEMLALIQISMGGQVAEELFFGDVSTGPGGDLLYATNVAAQMVGAVGMSESLISYGAVQSSSLGDTNLVGRVLADPDSRARVEELLQEQKTKATALLDANRHLVEALRDALMDRHELVGREITDVLVAARERGRTIDLRANAPIFD